MVLWGAGAWALRGCTPGRLPWDAGQADERLGRAPRRGDEGGHLLVRQVPPPALLVRRGEPQQPHAHDGVFGNTPVPHQPPAEVPQGPQVVVGRRYAQPAAPQFGKALLDAARRDVGDRLGLDVLEEPPTPGDRPVRDRRCCPCCRGRPRIPSGRPSSGLRPRASADPRSGRRRQGIPRSGRSRRQAHGPGGAQLTPTRASLVSEAETSTPGTTLDARPGAPYDEPRCDTAGPGRQPARSRASRAAFVNTRQRASCRVKPRQKKVWAILCARMWRGRQGRPGTTLGQLGRDQIRRRGDGEGLPLPRQGGPAWPARGRAERPRS